MPFDHCGHTAINFVFLCTCVDIDFTDSPLYVFVATGVGIEARDVIPGGQGGHLDALGKPMAHRDDQMDLYAAFDHKPLPCARDAVEQQAVSEKVIKVPVDRE